MRSLFVLLAACAFLCSMSRAQDQQSAAQGQGDAQNQQSAPPPSLGDVARQLKLKKQQKEAEQKAKEAPNQTSQASGVQPAATTAKTAQLVTNDDPPERATVTSAASHSDTPAADSQKGKGDHESAQTATGDHEAQGENWKSQILALKSAIASLEQDIKGVGDSIHYAGGNCIANCAQWNERQQQKQQEVDTMKTQLEEAQKQLEEMQESARKAGFGSSVYDPSE